jgi:hypothetical protein
VAIVLDGEEGKLRAELTVLERTDRKLCDEIRDLSNRSDEIQIRARDIRAELWQRFDDAVRELPLRRVGVAVA